MHTVTKDQRPMAKVEVNNQLLKKKQWQVKKKF